MNNLISLRPADDGSFDELVAKNATVHIEMMDDETVWMSIETETQSMAIWISSKKPLRISTEDQSPHVAK